MRHSIYFFLLVLFLNCPTNTNAQSNNNFALGWRFGWTEGITARASLNNDLAIEGIFGFMRGGYNTCILLEKFKETNVPNLSIYYGAGVHIGRTRNNFYYPYYKDKKRYYNYYGRRHWGLDAIIGIEYAIPQTPIAISLDLKPSLNFYDNGYSEVYPDPGLGLKVIF